MTKDQEIASLLAENRRLSMEIERLEAALESANRKLNNLRGLRRDVRTYALALQNSLIANAEGM